MNFKHFMDVHKEYLDKFYVPKGNEMLYSKCHYKLLIDGAATICSALILM